MADPKLYREIPVGDLPDTDWVELQAVPDDVLNIYALWPGRASVEIVPVWWDAGADEPVYDNADVTVWPIELKKVREPVASQTDPLFQVYCNATVAAAGPAYTKLSLVDTSADAMYLRVTDATPPGAATHLRLIVEVTT